MLVYGQIIQHDINAIIYYKNMKIKKRYTSALQIIIVIYQNVLIKSVKHDITLPTSPTQFL